MKKIFLIVLFFITINSITAQNTTFDNVSIGISSPAYGAQVKANFTGYTGGWSRGFSIANESGNDTFFIFATNGSATNGVSSVSSSFIGKNLSTRYMTFLPNGNIGIGTANPQNILQIGEYINSSGYKLSIPGAYNFEEIKLGQYGNGRGGLEIITHANATSSFGVRLFAGTDTGFNGLLFQTADASSTSANLTYSNKMAIALNGNVGIGTIAPIAKFHIVDTNGGIFFDGSNTAYNRFKSTDIAPTVSKPLLISAQTSGTTPDIYVNTSGNVGLGTTNPSSKLTVAGNIASREVKVTVDAGADFVFEEKYNLPSLESVDQYIKENKHLPEIASAQEMQKDGINLSEMNIKLLQKIEEMTLYMIEQNKKIKDLEQKIELISNK